MTEGYYCVVCGKYIEAVDGVIVHDDIPHPDMTFERTDSSKELCEQAAQDLFKDRKYKCVRTK